MAVTIACMFTSVPSLLVWHNLEIAELIKSITQLTGILVMLIFAFLLMATQPIANSKHSLWLRGFVVGLPLFCLVTASMISLALILMVPGWYDGEVALMRYLYLISLTISMAFVPLAAAPTNALSHMMEVLGLPFPAVLFVCSFFLSLFLFFWLFGYAYVCSIDIGKSYPRTTKNRLIQAGLIFASYCYVCAMIMFFAYASVERFHAFFYSS